MEQDYEDYGARNTDPDTSHAAFGSVDTTVLENAVWVAIAQRGARGATWYEIHQLTAIAMQSISPRFKPLRRKNRIKALEVDGKVVKRPGESNRNQIVWVAV